MVYKLCADCQRYFAGELNGSYVCPDCRARQQSVAAGAAAGAAGRPDPAPNAPRAA